MVTFINEPPLYIQYGVGVAVEDVQWSCGVTDTVQEYPLIPTAMHVLS